MVQVLLIPTVNLDFAHKQQHLVLLKQTLTSLVMILLKFIPLLPQLVGIYVRILLVVLAMHGTPVVRTHVG
jgi:hypothetical protein